MPFVVLRGVPVFRYLGNYVATIEVEPSSARHGPALDATQCSGLRPRCDTLAWFRMLSGVEGDRDYVCSVIEEIAGFRERKNARFALAGAFARHACGLSRATSDPDFVTAVREDTKLGMRHFRDIERCRGGRDLDRRLTGPTAKLVHGNQDFDNA